MNYWQRKGLMLVISSPSGAGKSTIAKNILAEDENISMSISATTRAKRVGEIDGKDYHFISKDKFQDMIDSKEFIEYAKVFDNYYGTPIADIKQKIATGSDILFDIDWQGSLQLKDRLPQDICSIFILPPSMPELKSRLLKRGTDNIEVINNRMDKARHEISHWQNYDYVIVNNDVQTAIDKVRAIIACERQKRIRQLNIAEFIRNSEMI